MCFFKSKEVTDAFVNSWGLSFKGNSEPEISIDKNTLNKYNAYYQGEKGNNYLYLTFDCGYELGYTESILNTLKNNNVKATFFIVGYYLNNNLNLVKRMINEGHNVCNHTYNHPNMDGLSLEKLENEISKLENTYYELTNHQLIKYFRPPQGIYNYAQLNKMSELGYKTIFWSVAYMDYDTKNQYSYQKALDLLKSRTHDGAIILLHNTSSTNEQILDAYIKYQKRIGFSFKKIDF
ncbi:MAG: polysaccharide deacetylase family protein [Bacilli bacterium]|nr:polysaccharide deacetylase family protein [Bacilli bacterium]